MLKNQSMHVTRSPDTSTTCVSRFITDHGAFVVLFLTVLCCRTASPVPAGTSSGNRIVTGCFQERPCSFFKRLTVSVVFLPGGPEGISAGDAVLSVSKMQRMA